MNSILIALLPDALLVLLGVGVRGFLSPNGWAEIERLNFQLLFPALIFFATIDRTPNISDFTVIGVGVWSIMLLGFALSYTLRPLGPQKFLDFAGVWQTAWRFNTAIALVAIQSFSEETVALMSIAIGCAVPIANILAVSALSRGSTMSFSKTLKMILLNPFLLASLAGVSIAISGWHLSDTLVTTGSRLANAAIPIALLSIGASLNIKSLFYVDLFLIGLNSIKLLALPIITTFAVWYLEISPAQSVVLIIFAALPTASAAHVLASVFGADKNIVATMVAQSTLYSIVSLPFWISLAIN